MWLWRVSSIACTVLPLLVLAVNFDKSGTFEEWKVFWGVLVGLYSLFRLYMFIEMFAALRAMPADAYKSPQWSQYFPGFG